MSAAKRGGLGRGLAALIPMGDENRPSLGDSASDVVLGARPGRPSRADHAGRTPERFRVHTEEIGAVGDSVMPKNDGVSRETSSLKEVGATYRELPLRSIVPNAKQPRHTFSQDALDELVHSISEFGLMQPIVVRDIGKGLFELIMGERRWRAAQLANLEKIPAIVRQTPDDDMLRDALLENIHRVQLNPLEEAAAYQQLLQEFGVTHDQLADRLGRSRPVITNMIRLLQLPVSVQGLVAEGSLTAGHARALLAANGGAEVQEALARRIVDEGMSVRTTENAVAQLNNSGTVLVKKAPAKPEQSPALEKVAHTLAANLDTRVTVTMGKRKGKIVIEFKSEDELKRIAGAVSQGDVH